MKPKHLLAMLSILAILTLACLLADSQNLGGIFRTPMPTATKAPPKNNFSVLRAFCP